MASSETREDLERRANTARFAGRDAEAIEIFEQIIARDLSTGQIARAVSTYQKLILWKPEDIDLHRRVSEAIASARDGRPPDSRATPAGPAQNALFGDMPKERTARILEKMKARHYSSGTRIVAEGDPGSSLFLLSEGSVLVSTRDESGRDVPLATLRTGDFFGEVSLLTSRPRTATVTAETDVNALELSALEVQELREQIPDIDRTLSEFHQKRAEQTVEALIERRHSSN